jgi:hypothetical protein
MAWKARKTAEGLVRRPDLLTLVSGAIANGDPDTDWPTKKALNAAVEQAMEAAGSSKGATAGTGFHSLTEAIDRGNEPLFVSDADRVRLDAYRAATASIEWLDIECFVVNDQVRAAGTFDRLGRLPDGRVVVADLKSGKSEADYPFATTVQIATYANGHRYDPETGARSPLHADLDASRRTADPPPAVRWLHPLRTGPHAGLAGGTARRAGPRRPVMEGRRPRSGGIGMSIDKAKATELRKPFPAESIGKLPKGGAMLDYVGHAAVTDRLLAVDP